VPDMTVFDDLGAEQDRLGDILATLSDAQWAAPSLAAGWTVRDVMVHLAQTEEMALARLTRTGNGTGNGSGSGSGSGTVNGNGNGTAATADQGGRTVEQIMADLVTADGATPAEAQRRWQEARPQVLTQLRAADPDVRVEWAAAPLKPAALATTRLAEHWTHGLDITGPLGIGFPDTGRLRHVAWLAHRMLPYAFGLAGEPAAEVRAELTAPDGEEIWRFGPPEAESAITGEAGAFCRVAAQRRAPARSGLRATGPDGTRALERLRSYAA
jgi:uncharacterized protein (TIGR03084 family)